MGVHASQKGRPDKVAEQGEMEQIPPLLFCSLNPNKRRPYAPYEGGAATLTATFSDFGIFFLAEMAYFLDFGTFFGLPACFEGRGF